MNTNLEDLERLFSSRMAEYDERLQKATASVSSQAQSSPVGPFLHWHVSFPEFKTFIWQVLDKFKSQMKLLSVGYDRHETAMPLQSAIGIFSAKKTRPILVRFMSTHHRQTVWEAKTALKGSGVTLSEFLTQTRHGVFLDARRHFGFKKLLDGAGQDTSYYFR
ncbi:hypothetical protein ACJJTC_012847 [Scirpophaga incertulas]